MRIILALVLALPLCGCQTDQERMAEFKARNNALDDQKCLGYGARPGTDAYVNCRANLDSARTTADAIVVAAPAPTVNQIPVPVSDAPKLQPMVIPGPRCTSRGC
jgi:hypothetical protein